MTSSPALSSNTPLSASPKARRDCNPAPAAWAQGRGAGAGPALMQRLHGKEEQEHRTSGRAPSLDKEASSAGLPKEQRAILSVCQ